MRKPICSVCGRPASAGGLCEEHYTSRHELFEIEPLELKLCEGCGSVFDRIWRRERLEDTIRCAIERAVKSHGNVERLEVALKKIGDDYIATITAHGTMPPAKVPKVESRQIKVRIRRVKCQNCVRLSGRYHEAVIQIRGERAERLLELAERFSGERPKRSEHLKYGWNLYFVNKADARAAIREIETELKRKKEKALEVIRSYKLVGKKLGKELWRDFYAIR